MLIFGTGLVAGALHVVSGPDHLAALTPLAVSDSERSARLGATWGFGHGLGVCVLGAIGMTARNQFDINILSSWSEVVVGIVLVVVGLWAIRRAFGVTIHAHGHDHDHEPSVDHVHYHVHTSAKHEHLSHQHAVLGVGALHGAAGTGHLFGVVPALALGEIDAVIYLSAYLFGAVASMSLYGGLIGRLVARGGQKLLRHLMVGSGGLAVSIGLLWSWNSWPA